MPLRPIWKGKVRKGKVVKKTSCRKEKGGEGPADVSSRNVTIQKKRGTFTGQKKEEGGSSAFTDSEKCAAITQKGKKEGVTRKKGKKDLVASKWAEDAAPLPQSRKSRYFQAQSVVHSKKGERALHGGEVFLPNEIEKKRS